MRWRFLTSDNGHSRHNFLEIIFTSIYMNAVFMFAVKTNILWTFFSMWSSGFKLVFTIITVFLIVYPQDLVMSFLTCIGTRVDIFFPRAWSHSQMIKSIFQVQLHFNKVLMPFWRPWYFSFITHLCIFASSANIFR